MTNLLSVNISTEIVRWNNSSICVDIKRAWIIRYSISLFIWRNEKILNFLQQKVENTHTHSSCNQLNCIGNNDEEEEAFDDK